MKNTFISFFLLFFLFISCDKKDEPELQNQDYILFGHFYGFCFGEQCVEIFKLTDNELFEDTKNAYPSWETFYEGQYKRLSNDQFELVKSIKDKVPFELTQEIDHVIGSPDEFDGGGVYFAIVDKHGTKFWLIDQFDENIPEYLRPFKKEINENIALINN